MSDVKVLHISLSHGGGVVSAINSYVANSDYCEHHLLADSTNGFNISDLNNNFSSVTTVKRGIKKICHIREVVRDIKPDFVHLHSSFAGFYGRIFIPFGNSLIYTPHCYSFEREDIGVFKKKLYLFVERFLSVRKCVVAACSPRELELANKTAFFNAKLPNLLLINYDSSFSTWSKPEQGKTKSVVMIGRLCPQKDPLFFNNVVAKFKECSDFEVDFVWIGDGDEIYIDVLKASSIKVTGWLNHSEVKDILLNSDLYFHSAAWEGCPMSLLEVSSIGLPFVSRNIKSISSLGVQLVGDTPEECALLLDKYFKGLLDNEAKEQSEALNKLCSLSNQENSLRVLYHV
jgi:glycosyltransferase involved in cell wall biosynthesis